MKNAHDKIQQMDTTNTDITHIFLTDGDITCGDDNPKNMTIPIGCKNIFIGYIYCFYVVVNMSSVAGTPYLNVQTNLKPTTNPTIQPTTPTNQQI